MSVDLDSRLVHNWQAPAKFARKIELKPEMLIWVDAHRK